MTALKVIGIILLIFLLIGLLRVGALVSFGEALCVRVRVGPLRLTVYPEKKKAKPAAEKPQPEEKPAQKPRKKRPLPKPTFEDLLDLAETAFSALGAAARRACQRLRVDPLEVTVVFGGDGADAAIRYGKASAAMYAVMPRLEACLHIPDPSLHLRVDFDAEGTSAAGTVGVSLRVGDLLVIGLTLAIPMLKWYLRFRRAHRRDAAASEARAPDAEAPAQDKIA